jgi:EAL domain-containing protein (putative c-di-GMP-specific phosphodiesterase class I)
VIPPSLFVPLAEASGLIVPIGRWIIESAAAALNRFDAAVGRPLYVSVNLSPQQFGDPDLLSTVRRVIQQHRLPPRQLTLEVTESLLIERIDQVVGLLNDCRGVGAEVSVDDFGTGFSSLSYLHRLPADVLKLDRVFVKQAEEGQAALKIVRAVTALAHELGMRVVQEGMESRDQAERTRSLGVDWAQGYFYSKPLNFGAALDYLARREPGTPAGAPAAPLDVTHRLYL